MAINAQPKVFNVVPGNSADTAKIQDAASSTDPSMSAIFPPIYQTPLSAGGKAPERATFNTLFKEYGEHLYFLQRGGVYGYDAALDYGKGATVYYNGSIYTAVAENGPSTDAGAVTPGKNASVWQKPMLESGNAATATKLAAKRTIALSGAATGTATGFDGTANIAIPVTSLDASKLTGTASVSTTGNAASATKLQTARTINGTAFNGTANITTANWGTARNISITDGTNTSTAVSVNGSANVSLKLPATIKATFVGNITGNVTGNAATATKATQDGDGNTITSKYVTLDTNQTISGAKTFNHHVYANNLFHFNGGAADTYEGGEIHFAPPTDTSTYPYNSDIALDVWRQCFRLFVQYNNKLSIFTFDFLNGEINHNDYGVLSVPTGTILPFGGTTIPIGYLICNGAVVSRTTYAKLFSVIGTTWGAGNGSTTFNLPDARDRVLQGASASHAAGSYIAAGLPNITGNNPPSIFLHAQTAGAHSGWAGSLGFIENTQKPGTNEGHGQATGICFDASKSNALYGANSTVQMPAIATNFIIKY